MNNNIENQDAFLFRENERFAFYAVADGVSSCKNSRQGAEIACRAASDIMLDEFDYFFGTDEKKSAWLIMSYIKSKLTDITKKCFLSFDDLASTLCFFCIDKLNGNAISFTLGDSHAYIINSDEATLANGTITYNNNIICATVTSKAEKNVKINYYNAKEYDGFILCTDGAWKCLFNKNSQNSDGKWYVKDYESMLKTLNSAEAMDDITFLYVA